VPETAGPTICTLRGRTRAERDAVNAVLKAHPDYAAAKAGDPEAAVRYVEAMVGEAELARARARFGPASRFVPVHAEESSGRNAIPQALAVLYAYVVGGRVETGIVQSTRAFHTGATAMQRLISRPGFDGPVAAGAAYVLVDDVSMLGGTLADLAHHVRQGGGQVIGKIVLCELSPADRQGPSPAQLALLEARHGNILRTELGVEPSALASGEALYIAGFRNADELGSAIAKARSERQSRFLAKGVRPDPGGEGGVGEEADPFDFER